MHIFPHALLLYVLLHWI